MITNYILYIAATVLHFIKIVLTANASVMYKPHMNKVKTIVIVPPVTYDVSILIPITM